MNENDLYIFHQSNTHPFIRKFLWDDEIISIKTSLEILKKVEAQFLKNGWGLWKIIETKNNNFVGYAGLWIFFDENQPQLLYTLLPEYTGKGFATEAATAIIHYAFEHLHFSYLIASIDRPNINSVKVCEKLNMDFIEEKIVEGKPTLFYIKKSYAKITV